MKIGLVQIKSESGQIKQNIDHHLKVLRSLKAHTTDLVVFPELSISNYEPPIALDTAISPDDECLSVFQQYAQESNTAIAIGAPIKAPENPLIGVIVFIPDQRPTIIAKKYLHEDETPFFSPSSSGVVPLELVCRIGIAICYELSVSTHTEAVMQHNPSIYIASVAKTPEGVASSQITLTRIATEYHLPVLLVNSVGTCDGIRSGGGTMAIGPDGRLLAQLDNTSEGMLVFDTESRKTTVWTCE